uniref:NAD-dependent epimerase/dehydratase domain-containing protein n=1 Tax=Chromera velia CCMP2878 TaxID=1169474 RepID=A0A0G4FBY4_9ALVE|eukprot:Cvel_16279.t1-p1 / transcript=Cvel_16279.t1 / gene=Cvel_16279 / organism=Chromera_velia_CCMP2878 / gene_product=Uncharacterized protein YLR290C, mitochondrial, putative / transcript_product=Uncharacterized protein YLR290C, mitochondrial, putative / location=Cvel_scaffold1246:40543-42652(-) / protein_length=326 / sequence_SO=supercontig / SO=protein_coding / is_pseudo=false
MGCKERGRLLPCRSSWGSGGILLLLLFTAAEAFSVGVGPDANRKARILVLGGTGFVGGKVCDEAAAAGMDVVAFSRRGRPKEETTAARADERHPGSITWKAGDAASPKDLEDLFRGDQFDAVVHAIGLLLDSESGFVDLNKLASGSGSVPSASSTYDRVTRQTALGALEKFHIHIANRKEEGSPLPGFPFLFISAAEAGWPDVPLGPQIESIAPPFLVKYLKAKRAVEFEMEAMNRKRAMGGGGIKSPLPRCVIFRPSLVWTPSRPQALLSVGPFYVGNALGVPFVDRPVTVEALAQAVTAAARLEEVQGVQRFPEIDKLSGQVSQ